jgi:Tol biopolymer transport system component
MFDDDESWVGIVDLENLSENPIEIMPTRGRRDYYLESWSHRPDWISIRETTRTGIKISVVEWPSGKVIPLQEFLGCRENSSWSPITHELAYQGNLNHNWDIFVELPGANNARNLTSTGEVNEYQPAWSPDGKYIAYVGVETRPGETTFWQELFVINVETGEKVQLTDSWDEYESLPIWSPDGTSIAYLSERNGALYLDSIEPNGANRTDLVRVPD